MVLVAALGLAGCASSTSGFVDEGSEDEGAIDTNAVKALMTSLGAIDPKERPIEYKPRAPLVVPPKRALPAPQDGTVLASRNFPRNQEDVDAELSKAGANDPDPGRAWTPEQLAKYRMATPDRRITYDEKAAARPLTPDELNGQHLRNKQAIEAANNAGTRRSLLQPPSEYRQPSAKAPIDPETEKSSWKPSWWPL